MFSGSTNNQQLEGSSQGSNSLLRWTNVVMTLLRYFPWFPFTIMELNVVAPQGSNTSPLLEINRCSNYYIELLLRWKILLACSLTTREFLTILMFDLWTGKIHAHLARKCSRDRVARN